MLGRQVLGGRYRIDGPLGQGGMGVVYRGTDLELGRRVAVKLIREDSGDPTSHVRFLREAKQTARLRHPCIVEVFDIGRDIDGSLFFVMELLDGESLSARLAREGRLDPAFVIGVAAQICDALSVAHAEGIVHRDLKLGNVMVVEEPEAQSTSGRRAPGMPRVKVLDFGLAKNATSQTHLTETGMLVGTLDYLPPEQIRAEPFDGRADLYSLGVMMYRMLTGRRPFEVEGVGALLHHHLQVEPPPMRDMVVAGPPVPRGLEAVVRRCLAKRPEMRFESAAALREALLTSLEAGKEVSIRTLPSIPAQSPVRELELGATAGAFGSYDLDTPVVNAPNAHLELEVVEPPRSVRPRIATAPPPGHIVRVAPAVLAAPPKSIAIGPPPPVDPFDALAARVPLGVRKGLLLTAFTLVVMNAMAPGGAISTGCVSLVLALAALSVLSGQRRDEHENADLGGGSAAMFEMGGFATVSFWLVLVAVLVDFATAASALFMPDRPRLEQAVVLVGAVVCGVAAASLIAHRFRRVLAFYLAGKLAFSTLALAPLLFPSRHLPPTNLICTGCISALTLLAVFPAYLGNERRKRGGFPDA